MLDTVAGELKTRQLIRSSVCLPVSAPFHSALMSKACDKFGSKLDNLSIIPSRPNLKYISSCYALEVLLLIGHQIRSQFVGDFALLLMSPCPDSAALLYLLSSFIF